MQHEIGRRMHGGMSEGLLEPTYPLEMRKYGRRNGLIEGEWKKKRLYVKFSKNHSRSWAADWPRIMFISMHLKWSRRITNSVFNSTSDWLNGTRRLKSPTRKHQPIKLKSKTTLPLPPESNHSVWGEQHLLWSPKTLNLPFQPTYSGLSLCFWKCLLRR